LFSYSRRDLSNPVICTSIPFSYCLLQIYLQNDINSLIMIILARVEYVQFLSGKEVLDRCIVWAKSLSTLGFHVIATPIAHLPEWRKPYETKIVGSHWWISV
jgi:hypothetical protein